VTEKFTLAANFRGGVVCVASIIIAFLCGTDVAKLVVRRGNFAREEIFYVTKIL
jgi:hypothetical protein